MYLSCIHTGRVFTRVCSSMYRNFKIHSAGHSSYKSKNTVRQSDSHSITAYRRANIATIATILFSKAAQWEKRIYFVFVFPTINTVENYCRTTAYPSAYIHHVRSPLHSVVCPSVCLSIQASDGIIYLYIWMESFCNMNKVAMTTTIIKQK